MTTHQPPHSFAHPRKSRASGDAALGAAPRGFSNGADKPPRDGALASPHRVDAGPSTGEIRLMALMMMLALSFSLLPTGLERIDYDDFAGQARGGSWRFQLQWLTVFGLAYLVLFRHIGRAVAAVKTINPMLLLMVAYTVLSMTWSAEPVITLKRVFQFTGLIAAGVAFQMAFQSGIPFFRAMLVTVTSILAVSAGVTLISPSTGYDPGFGTAWRGILTTKNDLGFVGGFGVILWVVRADLPQARWTHVVAGLAVSALCMVKATSSTGIATSILGVAVYLVLRRRYIGSTLWLARLMVGGLLVGLLLLQVFYIFEARLPLWGEIIGPFAAGFGKGTDLTGRTEIWEHVFIQFLTHPFGGIGWGAFWLGPGSASQPVLDQLPWIPYQAHNGYLDMLNELGGVGMAIFLAMLLVHVAQLVRMAGADPSQAAFHGTMMVIVLFSNFSESSLYKAVSFPHILLILSSIMVSAYRQPASTGKPASVPRKVRTQQGQQVAL